ncbi:MAG: intermembrane transport protein PqiB [Pseudomonadales bacterium]
MADSVVVERGRWRLSAIWAVPLVAVVLGIYLAVDAYLKQGPTITIRFDSAESIQAEKTQVKVREVTVGTVTGVRLTDDLSGVVVTADLTPESRKLLRDDTQFWVMKAEVRGVSVSGLGTLLSGAYIEIAPGVGSLTERRHFQGLERRPVSPAGTPGRRLQLVSESTGTISVGSPVLFRGYQVGTVETIDLDTDRREVIYSILVDAPYDKLVTDRTRFWNASGVSAELSSEGVKLGIGSLQSALMGGISFDLPRNTRGGRPVEDNAVFRLYPNESSIHENPYTYYREYVIAFRQSLRGLHPDAPVTYRGIRVGSVVRIMLADLTAPAEQDERGQPIPVLVRLEPGRMAIEDSPDGMTIMETVMEQAVELGLRAKLSTGNLLTGSMYVETDFFDTGTEASVGTFQGYPTIPAVGSSLEQIQVQVTDLLEKLNRLPVEDLIGTAEGAVTELEATLAAVRGVVESDALQALPMNVQGVLNRLDDVLEGFDSQSEFQHELIRSLDALKQALKSVDALAGQIEAQPSSLVFPSTPPTDPQPRAPR